MIDAVISAEEFDLLTETDERRLEYFNGQVIEVPPARAIHNIVVGNLVIELRSFAKLRSLGLVLAWSDFQLGQNWRLIPDIAIGVLSPSESAAHVDRKITAYLEA